MRKHTYFGGVAIIGVALLAGGSGLQQTLHASRYRDWKPKKPVVFQAAGPTTASIQSMVDAFRAALGGVNNGNALGPLADGRREINWDGGGSTATSLVPTPFDGFLVTRGGRFTTRGTGFVQAPLDGLVSTFNNPTYATIFQAFSPVRLFSPIESNVTNARFFVPGGGELAATTSGFGAIFSDVDQPDGDDKYDGKGKYGDHDRGKGDDDQASTSMSFYGVRGNLLYDVDVPPAGGDAGQSFVGVLFDDPRIAYVRIKAGNVAPGPNDSARKDVVMMDDFIYGEPQMIEDVQSRQDVATLLDN